MKTKAILAAITVGMTALSFFGCSADETKQDPPKADPPPAFEPGELQQRTELAAYPPGPYGIGKGSIIPNLSFIGFPNPLQTAAKEDTKVINLGDFYNPHGRDAAYVPASAEEDDRIFPKGSLYGEGKGKPTVLAIDVASVWCSPCKAEAQCVLPVLQHRYEACGGGFLLQLQDGPVYGKPATPTNLYTWTVKTYKESFPAVIDPQGRLIDTVATAAAFPQNILIDTTTMQIVEVIAGVPDSAYWKKYEKLLADPTCPAKQSTCESDSDCDTGKYCSTTCPSNPATCILKSCQSAGCKNQ